MATYDGECIFDLFYLIGTPPISAPVVLPLPNPTSIDCCSNFVLNVFGDLSSSDAFKNDFNGFLYSFKDVVSIATFKLQKFVEEVCYQRQNQNEWGIGINTLFTLLSRIDMAKGE